MGRVESKWFMADFPGTVQHTSGPGQAGDIDCTAYEWVTIDSDQQVVIAVQVMELPPERWKALVAAGTADGFIDASVQQGGDSLVTQFDGAQVTQDSATRHGTTRRRTMMLEFEEQGAKGLCNALVVCGAGGTQVIVTSTFFSSEGHAIAQRFGQSLRFADELAGAPA
jgi:hypothetical protein